MKRFLRTLALAMALGAGSLPASADSYDSLLSGLGGGESLSRSGQQAEHRGVYRNERGGRLERRRVARAAINDDEDFDYRPRRAVREEARGGVRAARKARGEHVRQASIERPLPQARPNWAKRSLSKGGATGPGQSGMASYYWQGQRVASGGWFNPNAMTAAHRSLPFGTRVRVTHSGSGRSVDVKINDRGPFVAGRIIDLSRAAASAIGMTSQGVAKVKVMVLGR
jgi:peptidoglycan lytic transglycosylase